MLFIKVALTVYALIPAGLAGWVIAQNLQLSDWLAWPLIVITAVTGSVAFGWYAKDDP